MVFNTYLLLKTKIVDEKKAEKYKSMGHRTKRFFQWSGKMGERF